MIRRLFICTLLVLAAVCNHVLAQQAAKGKNTKARKIFEPPVYLGHSDLYNGPIKKTVFDSLLKQGLESRDSLGNYYRIVGFDFSYAERNLYEDSVGNLVVLTDFSSETCHGNKMPSDIAVADTTGDLSLTHEEEPSIYQRTKAGDTAYFDHIRLLINPGNKLFTLPDTVTILGRDMKFVITR